MVNLNTLRFDTVPSGKEIIITFEKGVGVILINPEGVMDFVFCEDDSKGESSNSATLMAVIVEMLKNKEIFDMALEKLGIEAESLPTFQ